jgi:hypothetical protein
VQIPARPVEWEILVFKDRPDPKEQRVLMVLPVSRGQLELKAFRERQAWEPPAFRVLQAPKEIQVFKE